TTIWNFNVSKLDVADIKENIDFQKQITDKYIDIKFMEMKYPYEMELELESLEGKSNNKRNFEQCLRAMLG
ncbi:MAG: hypothetical protein R6V52_01735, partial [Bacteroidales bacterium]